MCNAQPSTPPKQLDQWVMCMALGLSVLPVNLLFRLVPSSLFPGST